MRKTFMLAVFGFLSLSLEVSGQDSLKTTNLNEVVVSATRLEQSLIETPRSVSVINREAIQKSVYNSVGELLGNVPGIYVVGANQTPGTNQGLFMRGTGSNQSVVMIDGVRITDPSSPNAAIDLSELSLTNVERIEIIKGSHSTIFGAGAIGGVINIITKKNQHEGVRGNAGLQAGTFGNGSLGLTENVDVTYSLNGGFYVNGSLFQQNVTGLNASLRQGSSPGVFSTSDKDDFAKTDAQIKTGFKNNVWDAFVAYKKTSQKADIDGGAFNDDENNTLGFDRGFIEYKIGYRLSDHWSASVLGSLSNSTRINTNDSSVVSEAGDYDHSWFKGTYNGKLQTHEVQLNYDFEKVRGVIGGGIYREEMYFDTRFVYNDPFFGFESVTDYDSIDTSANTVYLFGQLNYSLENFGISVGSRFSDHSIAGNYLTFEVNPSYKVNNSLFYASLSTGFNAPSLYQLYDPTKGFGAFTTRGNKKLESETSVSLEAGVKKEFNGGSYFTLSAFQTTVENSIEYIYLWEGSQPVSALGFADYRGDTYINIAKQKIQGVEVEGSVPLGDKVVIGANVSAINGSVTVDGNDISDEFTGGHHVQLYNFGTFVSGEYENKNLTRRPKLIGNLQIGYSPISDLSLNFTYRYAGSRYDVMYDGSLGPFGALKQTEIDAYNLFDFGANWRLSKVFSIGLKVENLLDEKYSEISGFRTRGRSGYLKLTARW